MTAPHDARYPVAGPEPQDPYASGPAAAALFPQQWSVWLDSWSAAEAEADGESRLVERSVISSVTNHPELSDCLEQYGLSPLPAYRTIHLLRRAIVPTYTDRSTRRGGHFSCRLPPTPPLLATQIWTRVAFAAAGELVFPNASHVVGVSLHQKPSHCSIKLWVKDAQKQSIASVIRRVLSGLISSGTGLAALHIRFTPHHTHQVQPLHLQPQIPQQQHQLQHQHQHQHQDHTPQLHHQPYSHNHLQWQQPHQQQTQGNQWQNPHQQLYTQPQQTHQHFPFHQPQHQQQHQPVMIRGQLDQPGVDPLPESPNSPSWPTTPPLRYAHTNPHANAWRPQAQTYVPRVPYADAPPLPSAHQHHTQTSVSQPRWQHHNLDQQQQQQPQQHHHQHQAQYPPPQNSPQMYPHPFQHNQLQQPQQNKPQKHQQKRQAQYEFSVGRPLGWPQPDAGNGTSSNPEHTAVTPPVVPDRSLTSPGGFASPNLQPQPQHQLHQHQHQNQNHHVAWQEDSPAPAEVYAPLPAAPQLPTGTVSPLASSEEDEEAAVERPLCTVFFMGDTPFTGRARTTSPPREQKQPLQPLTERGQLAATLEQQQQEELAEEE